MPDERIGAIVLAAGESSRLGMPKQGVPFRGESLLRRATRAPLDAGCKPVVVVTGAHAELSRAELAHLDASEAYNTEWQSGLASSIRAGLAHLLHKDAEVDAVILMLCDQPLVTAELLRDLIVTYHDGEHDIVASTYGGTAGAPALFGCAIFPELARLQGSDGAKHVIARHVSCTQLIPFPDGAVDVDTPADLTRLLLSSAPSPP